MQQENSTLDDYVKNYFRIDNPNPTYVFVIPDENNRTIIFKRSDFRQAIFPNITTINKFRNKFNLTISLTTGKDDNQNSGDDYELFSNLRPEKLIKKTEDYSDFDEEMLRIVAENVRTERNFIKKMEEINSGSVDGQHESFTTNPKTVVIPRETSVKPKSVKTKKSFRLDTSYAGSRKIGQFVSPDSLKVSYRPHSSDDDWDSLGLEGWSGGLREVKGELNIHERYTHIN